MTDTAMFQLGKRPADPSIRGQAGWTELLDFDVAATGRAMHDMVVSMLPVCRSITGEGVRETLAEVGRYVPLQTSEIPTGTKVLGWEVPPEWNIRSAVLTGPDGQIVANFTDSPLHVMGYSVPVDVRLSLEELRPHLLSEPSQPDAIPYRTSFYRENWAFCLADSVLSALPDGEYHAVIDSTLAPGSLTYGEIVIPGSTTDEVLLSAHTCHPGLANDNMAGIALATALAQALGMLTERHYTYRIVLAPSTIGAITWLAQNQATTVPRIRHGLIITCVGDPGPMTYKRSRQGTADVDRAAAHVLSSRDGATTHDFFPWGYDERQYCSPGFNLPVGCLMRTPHGGYPEYHTSADNADFVTPHAMADSLHAYLEVIQALEGDRVYVNQKPYGEPKLGDYDLYPSLGGVGSIADLQLAIMWVLNASDGSTGLLDIAIRAGMHFSVIHDAATRLARVDLIVAAEPQA